MKGATRTATEATAWVIWLCAVGSCVAAVIFVLSGQSLGRLWSLVPIFALMSLGAFAITWVLEKLKAADHPEHDNGKEAP